MAARQCCYEYSYHCDSVEGRERRSGRWMWTLTAPQCCYEYSYYYDNVAGRMRRLGRWSSGVDVGSTLVLL